MHLVFIAFICINLIAAVAWFAITTIMGGPLSGTLHHSFGVVKIERPATVLTHTFRLVNKTDHELQLTNAVPSCGCTTTQWPKEPVAIGEELVVPVNLTLRRSQLRSSNVRLEFATGEVAVLRIDGVGRFSQPLSILPPTPILYVHSMQGTRAMLSLEWSGEGNPTKPSITVPEGLQIEFDDWVLSKEEDTHKGIPELWTIRMRLMLATETLETQEFVIRMRDTPELVVSFTIDKDPPGAIRD